MNQEERRRLEGLATEGAAHDGGDLDLMDTAAILGRIHEEDRTVAERVRVALPDLAGIVDGVVERLDRGGRLHYFGAGTSGRLGVLDAAECPPTFGVSPDLIVGHMAGGRDAVFVAVEGAEDDFDLGRRDVAAAGIAGRDAVVAISASGRTPYCLGVLEAARDVQAMTVAIVCNQNSEMAKRSDRSVVIETGPEVLSGSTRMKAGTGQKLVLNMLSTAVMIRLGYTYGNLMVAVRATNAKLEERARRLVTSLTGASEDRVDRALRDASFDVRVAVIALRLEIAADEARRILEAEKGSLRAALGEGGLSRGSAERSRVDDERGGAPK